MIVDAHAHLWQRSRTPQPWIDPDSMTAIDSDFWVDDLVAMQRSIGVDRSVLVQTAHLAAETLDLLELAHGHPSAIAGVVGWIDLRASPGEALSRLRDHAGGARLVGIRHLLHQEPDSGWAADPRTGNGLDLLGSEGVPFDLVLRPDQLSTGVRLAAAHPGTRFVLDHLGKPPLASAERHPELFDVWRRDLDALAASPNTVAKLSGLVTEADWTSWTSGRLQPAIAHALDVFGPDRLMIGSDWPVAELAGGAGRWMGVALDAISGRSARERAALLGGTAIRVYGLGDVTPSAPGGATP